MRLIPIIVTYNRLDKLKVAIDKWLKTDIYKLVIVNNNSTDGTKEYLINLSSKHKKVIVLNLPENIGGAGGFFEGIKYVHTNIKDYDWVVLHDDDAYPNLESINYFLYQKDLSTADSYMSAVYYPSGKISLMNMPGYLPFKTLKQFLKTIIRGNQGFHIESELYYQDKEVDVDFASFVGLFVSRKVVDKVGFPKKDFFIYGDDLEYTIRITNDDFKIKFDPNLKFIHDCETLHFEQKKIYKPLWKAYFTYRNGIYIYKKLSGRLFPLVLLNKIITWSINGMYYEDKKRYFSLMLKAIKDGLFNNFNNNIDVIKNFTK